MADSVLEQRRIEAAFAGRIHAGMAAIIGAGQARAIPTRMVVRLAKAAAADMAQDSRNDPSLAHSISLQPRRTRGDAPRIEQLQAEAGRHGAKVTRCRPAGMHRALGLAEPGDLLSRNRDGAFGEGHGPRLTGTRTRTIRGGATHRDIRHRYEG